LTQSRELSFRLEGVVKTKDARDDFEGPLNLILMLLSKNKIEIRDIKISLILEQYLDYIAQARELDLEIASSFAQMAAHLVYIKTRTLLAGEHEVSELEQLIESLEKLKGKDDYAAIKEVVPLLLEAHETGLCLLTKPPEPLKTIPGDMSNLFTAGTLAAALTALAKRLAERGETAVPGFRAMPKRIIYNVRDKSRQLLDILRLHGNRRLSELFGLCGSRSEVVAAFVSILELCAHGSITLSDTGDGDLMVSFSGGDIESILSAIGNAHNDISAEGGNV